MLMETDRRLTHTDDPIVVALVVKTDDHENRIRMGERFRWMATGVLAFVGFAFPATVGAVAAVLSK